MPKDTKLQLKLIERLQAVCDDLGVILGIPQGDEVGVLIGTKAFIESVADIVGEADEYTAEQDYEDALAEVLDLPKVKKNDDPSFH
jgi:hypothetical protein